MVKETTRRSIMLRRAIMLKSTQGPTPAVTESWITKPASDSGFMAEFTPSVNMSVKSFSMVLNNSTKDINYSYGIYVKTASGSDFVGVPVANSVGQNITGITVTAGSILGSYTKYTHKKTYTTYPNLTAGVTYFFSIGERYASVNFLSGTNVCRSCPDWSLGNNPTAICPANSNKVFLSVESA